MRPTWLDPDYPASPPVSELVRSHVSRLRQGVEVDAWGMAREIGRADHALSVQHELDQLAEEGVLNREGNWYSLAGRVRSNPLLAIVGNPPNRDVHPLAFEARDRYREDMEAGHTGATEYWRGQAGAFFTMNPSDRCLSCGRQLSDKDQRHGYETCDRCASGHVPEGSMYSDRNPHGQHWHGPHWRGCECGRDYEVGVSGTEEGCADCTHYGGVNYEAAARSEAERLGIAESKRPKKKAKKAKKKPGKRKNVVAGAGTSGSLKRGKVRKNRTASKGNKKPKPRKKTYTVAEARKHFEGVDEAVKAYKRFHGREPKEVTVYELPDGKKKATFERAHAALHRTIETNYLVPWESNKKGSLWKHEHVEGYGLSGSSVGEPNPEELPLEILDPATGTTRKIAGNYKVTSWWYD